MLYNGNVNRTNREEYSLFTKEVHLTLHFRFAIFAVMFSEGSWCVVANKLACQKHVYVGLCPVYSPYCAQYVGFLLLLFVINLRCNFSITTVAALIIEIYDDFVISSSRFGMLVYAVVSLGLLCDSLI